MIIARKYFPRFEGEATCPLTRLLRLCWGLTVVFGGFQAPTLYSAGGNTGTAINGANGFILEECITYKLYGLLFGATGQTFSIARS